MSNTQGVRGIVWGSTNDSASIKLTEIIDRYVNCGYEIKSVADTKYHHYVIFTNGDCWKAIAATENQRGNRCNIAYIERNIDYNIYRTIIVPTIKIGPFSAINLWGEGNLHISDTSFPELPF